MWIIPLIIKEALLHIQKETKPPKNTKLVSKLFHTLLKQGNELLPTILSLYFPFLWALKMFFPKN